MATGWPADSDLADRLGLGVTDDPGRVSSANAAAQADAIAVCGLDPDAGTVDGGQFEAVLMLGQWWYENRNRPEGLDSLNPVATPYYRRTALGIIMRGAMPVAVIADALAAVVAALEAEGLRVAVRSGDITPPVVYVQIGQASDAGGTLAGARVPTFWCYYIPVRGLDNAAGDAAALDQLYDALSHLTLTELVTVRTSLTVLNDTWPCYRADAAVMALTPSEV